MFFCFQHTLILYIWYRNAGRVLKALIIVWQLLFVSPSLSPVNSSEFEWTRLDPSSFFILYLLLLFVYPIYSGLLRLQNVIQSIFHTLVNRHDFFVEAFWDLLGALKRLHRNWVLLTRLLYCVGCASFSHFVVVDYTCRDILVLLGVHPFKLRNWLWPNHLHLLVALYRLPMLITSSLA